MILYHATPKSNLESITANGLDPALAIGKIKGVWLHTKSKTPWAVLHTANRHSISTDDVVVLEVEVPRKHLTRRWRGLWTSAVMIRNFKRIITGTEIAESPVQE